MKYIRNLRKLSKKKINKYRKPFWLPKKQYYIKNTEEKWSEQANYFLKIAMGN